MTHQGAAPERAAQGGGAAEPAQRRAVSALARQAGGQSLGEAEAPEDAESEPPAQAPIRTVRGEATFYGEKFAGRRTASGETFDPDAMTAASAWFPLDPVVRVINPSTGEAAVVRINDRPGNRKPGASDIDLSRGAAEKIGIIEEGRAEVRIELLERSGS